MESSHADNLLAQAKPRFTYAANVGNRKTAVT